MFLIVRYRASSNVVIQYTYVVNYLEGSKIILVGEQFQPTVGTLITVLNRMDPVFTVEVDVMMTGDQRETFTNIVHITRGGGMEQPGDRMPLISLFPNENRLHISSYVNGNINYAYNPPEIWEFNVWTKIRVQQRLVNSKYIYSVYINDNQYHTVENTTPISLYNVKVYASDPWSGTPKAVIRNFRFSTQCKKFVCTITVC